MDVLPGDGRQTEELRRRNGDIAVDPLGDLDQFLNALLRKGVPEVVQGDEPMLRCHMVEQHKEGLKKEFTDNEGDVASAEQNYTCHFRFLCGHEILSISVGAVESHRFNSLSSKRNLRAISMPGLVMQESD